jgi:hypothetical protein
MYNSLDSIDTALNNRPHVIDGKQVDPKRAVPLEVSHHSVLAKLTYMIFQEKMY